MKTAPLDLLSEVDYTRYEDDYLSLTEMGSTHGLIAVHVATSALLKSGIARPAVHSSFKRAFVVPTPNGTLRLIYYETEEERMFDRFFYESVWAIRGLVTVLSDFVTVREFVQSDRMYSLGWQVPVEDIKALVVSDRDKRCSCPLVYVSEPFVPLFSAALHSCRRPRT